MAQRKFSGSQLFEYNESSQERPLPELTEVEQDIQESEDEILPKDFYKNLEEQLRCYADTEVFPWEHPRDCPFSSFNAGEHTNRTPDSGIIFPKVTVSESGERKEDDIPPDYNKNNKNPLFPVYSENAMFPWEHGSALHEDEFPYGTNADESYIIGTRVVDASVSEERDCSPFSQPTQLTNGIEQDRQERQDIPPVFNQNLKTLRRYTENGVFPWEQPRACHFSTSNAKEPTYDDSLIIGPRGNNEHSAADGCRTDAEFNHAAVNTILRQLYEQVRQLTPITRTHAAIANTSDASKGNSNAFEVDVQQYAAKRAVVLDQARDTTSTQDQTQQITPKFYSYLEQAQKRALEPTDDVKPKKPKVYVHLNRKDSAFWSVV